MSDYSPFCRPGGGVVSYMHHQWGAGGICKRCGAAMPKAVLLAEPPRAAQETAPAVREGVRQGQNSGNQPQLNLSQNE